MTTRLDPATLEAAAAICDARMAEAGRLSSEAQRLYDTAQMYRLNTAWHELRCAAAEIRALARADGVSEDSKSEQ